MMGKIVKMKDKKAVVQEENNRVQFAFEKGGERTFYVKFYEQELYNEMKDLVHYYMTVRKGASLEITEMDGTFKVSSKAIAPDSLPFPIQSDAWDILMHKYFALSHQIRKENGERYYPLRFSDSFISPDCPRAIVV